MSVFDLKGSTHKRETHGCVKPSTVLKDLDFLKIKREHHKFLRLASTNRALIKVLRRDVHFLRSKMLLDYSLLFAVEKSNKQYDEEKAL